MRWSVAVSSEMPSSAKNSHCSGIEHGVGGGERVHGEEAQARRAVDDHVVVAADHRRQGLLEPELAGEDAHELDLGPGEVAVGGHEGQVLEVGRHHQLLERPLLDERLVEARPALPGLAAEARGQVALGVGVDGEHPPLGGGQARGEVDGGRGLADPALLVGDRDRASQGPLSVSRWRAGRIARRRPAAAPVRFTWNTPARGTARRGVPRETSGPAGSAERRKTVTPRGGPPPRRSARRARRPRGGPRGRGPAPRVRRARASSASGSASARSGHRRAPAGPAYPSWRSRRTRTPRPARPGRLAQERPPPAPAARGGSPRGRRRSEGEDEARGAVARAHVDEASRGRRAGPRAGRRRRGARTRSAGVRAPVRLTRGLQAARVSR